MWEYKNICQLTSVHGRYDTRIFLKEIKSLSNAGFKIFFFVADGLPNDISNEEYLKIINIKFCHNRIVRIFFSPIVFLCKASRCNASIYHFHDPELILTGLLLRLIGKNVIYDVHEDVPRDILSKYWIPKYLRPIISVAFEKIENFAAKNLSGIVAATPHISARFAKLGAHTVNINNYPILEELNFHEIPWQKKKQQICYIGGLGSIRGLSEMVRAMELLKSEARLALGGRFSDSTLEKEVKAYKGWSQVDTLGWLDREQIRNTLKQSIAGLVTLHPIINYLDSLPVKMFEYMSAGIPVIASDFPLWREIVEGNQCGICVDPLKPEKIARAIDILVENPALAEEMGKNGQRAVEKKYNWKNEEKKLLKLYNTLLKENE